MGIDYLASSRPTVLIRTQPSRPFERDQALFLYGLWVGPIRVHILRRAIVAAGTIKKAVVDRGFGFIKGEDGQEYFFHRSSVDPSMNFEGLAGGESVTFEVEQSDKGPRAVKVHPA